MDRSIAFLRAINVGGHTVKMDKLRQEFELLGFQAVETFIASGNVIFQTTVDPDRDMEIRMEKHLQAAFGFDVAAFIRTDSELARIAVYVPFAKAQLENAKAFNIGFLHQPLTPEQSGKLMSLRTEIDDFHVHQREIYWLCKTRQSDSTFSNAVLERALKLQATWRGANTVQKIVGKYCHL